MRQSRLFTDVKSLVSKSVIYGLGSILLKGIAFLLLPLYTRYLTPADYGVIAVTSTLMSVLGILYPLGLHGALLRFYFNAQSETERRQNNGVIWLGMTLAALSMTLLLNNLGNHIFPWFFQEVSFDPYIRLAIWIAFFNVLSLLPLNLLQIQERPGLYVLTSITSTLLSIGLIINLIVFQKQGVYGYLLGMFLAAVLLAIPYLIFTLRQVQLVLRWEVLKAALIFSLPLIPHSLAGWILELSDRVILERFVSLEELGLYALAYQFGTIMSLFATAINLAWVPFLYKTDAERGEVAKQDLARLATYYALCLCFVALGLTLFVKNIIFLMTAPAFHSAYQIAPWIIGGWLLCGLYYIPINFLFLREKTRLVPIATVLAGIVNVGLNLWLAPRYGVMAAAWSTFLAYGLMLVLVWWLARRVYPFPYEYRRLGLITLAVFTLFILGVRVQFDLPALDLAVKGGIWLAYPGLLILFGFFTPMEKKMALSVSQQALVALRRTARWV